MNKNEYLEKLRELLSYELPERLVKKNIDFYAEYFKEKKAQGLAESEIAEDLGDPQLIARSCIEAAKSGEDGIPNSGDDPDFHKEIYGNPSAEKGSFNSDGTRSPENGNPAPENRGNGGFYVNGRNIGCGTVILGFFLISTALRLLPYLLYAAGRNPAILLIGLILLWLLFSKFRGKR